MDSQTQVRLVRRKSILSLLLYGLGIVLGGFAIFIASWGGMESIFFNRSPNSSRVLTSLRCPMLISKQEVAHISATVANPSKFKVNPLVTANISAGYFTVSTETETRVMLEPRQKASFSWEATVENAAYNGRLIFVHVNVGGSYPLEPSNGTCGIVVMDLGSIRGDTLLSVIAVLGMLLTAGGWWSWYKAHPVERSDRLRGLTNGLRALGIILLVGVLVSFLKLWFAGILALAIIILLVVILWSQYAGGD